MGPERRASFPIIAARLLAPGIKRLEVLAPGVSRRWRAGQFVITRVHERGERIPLTVAACDRGAGAITLVVQEVGKTTALINRLEPGDSLRDVVGPLGNPSEVRAYGTVVVVGGGVGAAIAYPTAVAMKEAGNTVLSIVGARTGELVILEEEIRSTSDELSIVTDDGTRGEKGVVTAPLARLLASRRVDRVLATGPIPMMRAVAELTRPRRIPTVVSVNSIMVDGTGMCGGCRVLVGGKSRFACVDGPEFDAHEVDFEVLARRNVMYRSAERRSLEAFLERPERDLEDVHRCRLEEKHEEVRALADPPGPPRKAP
jgi:ferredoxin--NADP+ reductase